MKYSAKLSKKYVLFIHIIQTAVIIGIFRNNSRINRINFVHPEQKINKIKHLA